MADHPDSHSTSQETSQGISQTYIYAGSLLLSFLLKGIWPALSPLMSIMQVICLMGILTFGPLEIYQLCRSSRA